MKLSFVALLLSVILRQSSVTYKTEIYYRELGFVNSPNHFPDTTIRKYDENVCYFVIYNSQGTALVSIYTNNILSAKGYYEGSTTLIEKDFQIVDPTTDSVYFIHRKYYEPTKNGIWEYHNYLER